MTVKELLLSTKLDLRRDMLILGVLTFLASDFFVLAFIADASLRSRVLFYFAALAFWLLAMHRVAVIIARLVHGVYFEATPLVSSSTVTKN